MNNADKHRFIQVTNLTAELIVPTTITLTREPNNVTHSPRLQGIEFKEGVPLKKWRKDWTVAIELQGGRVGVDVDIASKVSFGQGCDAVNELEVMTMLKGAFNASIQTVNLFLADPALN